MDFRRTDKYGMWKLAGFSCGLILIAIAIFVILMLVPAYVDKGIIAIMIIALSIIEAVFVIMSFKLVRRMIRREKKKNELEKK